MDAYPYIAQTANDLIANGETVLLLDAGDTLHGQTLTNLSKGEVMTALMNKVGCDAMVPGNIRASIESGDVTMGQVLTTMPFSNLLMTVELEGSDLLQALEHGVSKYPEAVGRHIQVTGMNLEFDPDAEPMHRVTKTVLNNGEPIAADKTYTVTVIEFAAEGGDGYDMISKGTNKIYYGGDDDAFAEYLSTNPKISDEPENRVRAVTKSGQADNLNVTSTLENKVVAPSVAAPDKSLQNI